jgi:DNA-binding transcriptional ArsR family regulator
MAAKSGAFRASREEKDKLKRVSGSATGAQSAETGAVNLNRLIHERTRLAIVSALAVNTSLTFNELKDLLGITDGNLSVHARKLEDAGYVSCAKSFDGRLPKTQYRLAAAGRRALEKYLDHMEALIRATRPPVMRPSLLPVAPANFEKGKK